MTATRTKSRKKDRKSGSRRADAKYRQLALTRATEMLLSCKVTGIEFPGGRSRESCRMLIDGQPAVIATRRDSLERARVEVQTLEALGRHAAPVPRLLATNRAHILIQQELIGQRLSAALCDSDAETVGRLLDSALSALARVHHAATAEKLESIVRALGDEDGWILGLLERPEVIGNYLKIRAPAHDKRALLQQLRIVEPRFIKWDARPGNALVDEQGDVYWFDWEHAGKRNRLDDMAWVLGDEFVPDLPTVEARLLDRHLEAFRGPMSVDEARHYLMVYGTFHMVVRLGLILKYMDGQWWDLDDCIAGDKVGVTLECAQRLCSRAARWSATSDLLPGYPAWFEAVSRRLEDL